MARKLIEHGRVGGDVRGRSRVRIPASDVGAEVEHSVGLGRTEHSREEPVRQPIVLRVVVIVRNLPGGIVARRVLRARCAGRVRFGNEHVVRTPVQVGEIGLLRVGEVRCGIAREGERMNDLGAAEGHRQRSVRWESNHSGERPEVVLESVVLLDQDEQVLDRGLRGRRGTPRDRAGRSARARETTDGQDPEARDNDERGHSDRNVRGNAGPRAGGAMRDHGRPACAPMGHRAGLPALTAAGAVLVGRVHGAINRRCDPRAGVLCDRCPGSHRTVGHGEAPSVAATRPCGRRTRALSDR